MSINRGTDILIVHWIGSAYYFYDVCIIGCRFVGEMIGGVMSQYIALIGTGGTIAGQGASETDLTGYVSGVLGLDEILTAVPQAQAYGPFLFTEFSNMESSDMREQQWLALARLVQSYVNREDVAGVVITHGTDSMEETSYFLHLTVATDKPVIMTGAMRPAGALSADGPLHILQALQLARSPQAVGKGVLVTLNGYIDGAREVTKQNTTDVATFGNRIFGHLGIMQEGEAHFYQASVRCHTKDSEFAVDNLVDTLPSVALLTCYAGIEDSLVAAVLNTSIEGLVLAGLGHGTLPRQVIELTQNLSIPCVRSSRTGSGIVSAIPTDRVRGYLVSDSLSPQKARILLMLGLTKTQDREQLQNYFYRY